MVDNEKKADMRNNGYRPSVRVLMLICIIFQMMIPGCARYHAHKRFTSSWKECESLENIFPASNRTLLDAMGKKAFYDTYHTHLKDSSFIGYTVDCLLPILGEPDFIYDGSHPPDTFGLMNHARLSKREMGWSYVLRPLKPPYSMKRDSAIVFSLYIKKKSRRVFWTVLYAVEDHMFTAPGGARVDSSCLELVEQAYRENFSKYKKYDRIISQQEFRDGFNFRNLPCNGQVSLPCLEKKLGPADRHRYYYSPAGGKIVVTYGAALLRFDTKTLSCFDLSIAIH